MTVVYPVIFSHIPEGFLASVPDLKIDTWGEDLPQAIFMARDAISLWCVTQQDQGNPLPAQSLLAAISCEPVDIVSLVDCDLDAYRRMLDSRAVRKNLTIPSWLNEKAEAQSINFSAVLQKALKEELHLAD